MRVVLQRVAEASVTVDGTCVGRIGQGFLVLVCAMTGDTMKEAQQLATKIAKLRVFADADGKMNKAVTDVGGACLVVSQFTLAADTRKGNRPSFVDAAEPEVAIDLCEAFVAALEGHGIEVRTGVFGADMQVSLVNDGPVTILLDTASS